VTTFLTGDIYVNREYGRYLHSVETAKPMGYLKPKTKTKRGLKKRTILHELFHHLVYVSGLEMTKGKEERDAESYARNFGVNAP